MTGIIVAFPKIETGKQLKSVLVRSGFQVINVCTSGSQALKEAQYLQDGVVLCSYKLPDMIYWELKDDLPNDFEMVTVCSEAQWNDYGNSNVLHLSSNLKVHELLSTMEMVTYNIERRRKKRRNAPKKRNEEEEKLIKQAKQALMDRNHMTEEEAHRYLQKSSMDNGATFTETAQMILSMLDG